jgi:pilus assembly protein Flp/PilA
MMAQIVLNWLAQFQTEEEGQGLVEYALILVLVSVVAIVTLRVLGTDVAAVFTDISGELTAA